MLLLFGYVPLLLRIKNRTAANKELHSGLWVESSFHFLKASVFVCLDHSSVLKLSSDLIKNGPLPLCQVGNCGAWFQRREGEKLPDGGFGSGEITDLAARVPKSLQV